MTRLSLSFVLALTSLVWGQQDWQGPIKQIYSVTIPPFQGNAMVYGKVDAGKNLIAPVEMYSLQLPPSDLKVPVTFYRTTLEKQGFKAVGNYSTPTTEKVEMLHAGRKLTAVVVAQKQTAQQMLIGVTMMTQGTIEKAQIKKK